jgi:hypothetical protein
VVRVGQRRVATVRPSTSLISATSQAAGSKPSAVSRPSQISPIIRVGEVPGSNPGAPMYSRPPDHSSIGMAPASVASPYQRGLLESGLCGLGVGADDDGVGDRDHLVDR